MALAILELITWESGKARFRIDTGTNALYQIKMGREVRSNQGMDWVDNVFFSSPMTKNEAGGNLFDSSQEIAVSIPPFDERKIYVQLFSFKNSQGKSPAFSRIVTLHKGMNAPLPANIALPFSMGAAMNITLSFQPPRRIPCRTHREAYAHQASLDDLLAGIVKLAAPVVLDLLKNPQNGGAGQTATGTANTTGQANMVAQILNAILSSIGGNAGKALGQSQSLVRASSIQTNRFAASHNTRYSQPFIFGIDDALLATLAGPIIQVLPQLLNSVNQQRLQMKQADNKLITDILSGITQRRQLEQLLQAQQAKAGGQQGNPDLAAVIQLLQQLPANSQETDAPAPSPTPSPAPPPIPPTPPPPSAPATPNPATTKSLSMDALPPSGAVSSKAVLSFVTADPMSWNGTPKLLFSPDKGITLKIRFEVGEPVPKMPLPKAIVKIAFKSGSNAAVVFEKTFKQKNVLPNATLPFQFTSEELARLPQNAPISVIAELRWLTPKSGKEYKALGSMEMILVSKSFVKAQGLRAAPERELTDMKQFRAFWNKIWEAPVLDAASGKGDERKTRWDLDVNMKYSVLLSAAHESNGVMEMKLLQGDAGAPGVFARTNGRMKAGIELSITELNKLLPLWDGAQPLEADTLQAFKTDAFARDNAGEFIFNPKLKGRAGERGMVWVIPTFALFEFPLGTVSTTDDSGQVTAVGEERVRFPLPVGARILGLKSE